MNTSREDLGSLSDLSNSFERTTHGFKIKAHRSRRVASTHCTLADETPRLFLKKVIKNTLSARRFRC